MKRGKIIFPALFLAAGLGVSRASLGDPEAQCIAKYGAEFEEQDNLGFDVVGDKAASFNLKTPHGSFVVKVVFFNGVAGHETYSNADPSKGLSEDQMKSILTLEGAGANWERKSRTYRTDRSDNTSEKQEWVRSDGAIARLWLSGEKAENESGEIELSTREYAAAQRNLDKQDGSN
jgi:hypothetical protein